MSQTFTHTYQSKMLVLADNTVTSQLRRGSDSYKQLEVGLQLLP